jgi:hypothetical protein
VEKMTPELKARWLTALRSGNYKQGFYKLKDKEDNTYCPLGVLAHVAGWKMSDGGLLLANATWDKFFDVLSEKDISRIWIMNDTRNFSFLKLAAWIEENV